jgi:hypothetical protein
MYAIIAPTIVPPKFEWNDLVPGCVKDGVAQISCIPAVFKNIIFALVLFAGIVAIFIIIQSGAKFVLSSGDPKKVEEARNGLVYALLGIILIAAAYLLVSLVSFFTGVKCLRFMGFECL